MAGTRGGLAVCPIRLEIRNQTTVPRCSFALALGRGVVFGRRALFARTSRWRNPQVRRQSGRLHQFQGTANRKRRLSPPPELRQKFNSTYSTWIFPPTLSHGISRAEQRAPTLSSP